MRADREAHATRPYPSAWRAVATFLVFVLVGPFVGLVTVTVTVVIFGPDKLSNLFQMATNNPGHLTHLAMLYLSLSYIFGGIPAILVGLVAAVTQDRSRLQRAPLWAVLLASLVMALIFFAVIFLQGASGQQPTFLVQALALVVVLHLAVGIGCWLIANGLLRLSGPHDTQTTA